MSAHSESETPQTAAQSAPFLKDLKAGFLVFLIALPLSLGIAVASGFPPIAGVLTAIIGGIFVPLIGSARLTIKGPAAGLIVIAIGAVTELGGGDLTLGYQRALAVGVLAALLQIAFAFFRTATVGIAMSPSVVHGMLAAIGVIIVSKQAHIVLGVAPKADNPLELLAELPESLRHANPEILLIGGLSLALLFAWPFLRRLPVARILPAPLAILICAVPLGIFFDLPHAHSYEFWSSHYQVGPEFLVSLPGSLLEAITFPDFSVLFSATSLKYALMFALVGTIESTLSVLAVDSLDPAKRASNLNRDLLGVGIGNLCASLIGGLPMISEIVRSKANIDAGAASSRANILHGAFLLLFVAAFPAVLQLIPLAALAAMLVYTGFRLAAPSELLHARRIGSDQLLLFTTTMIVTLATDLLIGVAIGLLLKVLLHFARGAGFKTLFRTKLNEHRDGGLLRLEVDGAATFALLLAVRKRLNQIETDIRTVILDLRAAVLVDHTFLVRVKGMADEFPNLEVHLEGLDEMDAASDHPQASRRRSS